MVQTPAQTTMQGAAHAPSGTEMGWLVEPEDSLIFVYGADRSVRVFEEAEAVLPVPGFAEAVRLTVGEVFDWLKD